MWLTLRLLKAQRRERLYSQSFFFFFLLYGCPDTWKSNTAVYFCEPKLKLWSISKNFTFGTFEILASRFFMNRGSWRDFYSSRQHDIVVISVGCQDATSWVPTKLYQLCKVGETTCCLPWVRLNTSKVSVQRLTGSESYVSILLLLCLPTVPRHLAHMFYLTKADMET